MSQFVSTRNKNDIVNEFEAIVKGLSNDGGLYTPVSFKTIDIDNLYNTSKVDNKISYNKLSSILLKNFFDDYELNGLESFVNKAYSLFDDEDVTPTTKIGDDFLLELYHGPTSAFKDVALTMLPHLMTSSYKKLNIEKLIYILCATSGDTGKAALEGFKDVDNTYITVFYPKGAVSATQELQMITTTGNNTNVVSVNANFDECQKIVKECMNNREEILKNKNVLFSSANSINIGRLIPQVVYYFKSYFDLVNTGEIKMGDKINFIVPTGNFGDILAGYFAKKIGLYIDKLVCATNKNDVLDEFLNTGVYNANREFYETISPSMDILVSSNLERLLFIESGCDSEYVKQLMNELNDNKKYTLRDDVFKNIKQTFLSYKCDDENIINTIKESYEKFNRVIDTHTACAVYATWNLKNQLGNNKNVILSTASPYKFSKSVLKAISNIDIDDDFQCMRELNKLSNIKVPTNLVNLKTMDILHDINIDAKNGVNYIKTNINKMTS